MYKLVLLRHGESTWNKENRFTGWTDVDLTPNGLAEARRAGELLRAEGFSFDLCYTSVLKRAIRTLWIALDEMELVGHDFFLFHYSAEDIPSVLYRRKDGSVGLLVPKSS